MSLPLSTLTSVSYESIHLTTGNTADINVLDPELLATTRRSIPVTVQRRFDVYPDVSSSFQ